MKVRFLILRGAPGVGKSTVAHGVRMLFPKGSCIEIDSLRMMLNANVWGNAPQHLEAIRTAAFLGVRHVSQGIQPVIFVDAFVSGYLETLTEHLNREDIRIHSLIASDDVLKSRILNRPDHPFKDWRRSIEINRHIAEHPVEGDRVIDTSALDVPSIIKAIVKGEP